MKVLFLHRDGVINKDYGYVHEIGNFEFMDGIFDLCDAFVKNGFRIIVVTNQSGIARGYFNMNDFKNITNWMVATFQTKGIDILDIFYCPHGPDENCNCRKPKSQLFLEAVKKYKIDTRKSWMIGDKESDIVASSNAGILNTVFLSNDYQNTESSALHHASNLTEIIGILDEVR